MILRFIKNKFVPEFKTTIGVEYASKKVKIENKSILLQIWDTSGSEQYRSVTKTYYKSASGAFLVFDISRKDTFDGLNKWLIDLRNTIDDNSPILLVGNKSDLGEFREVTILEAVDYAQKNDLAYIETSALEDSNIEEAFQNISSGI